MVCKLVRKLKLMANFLMRCNLKLHFPLVDQRRSLGGRGENRARATLPQSAVALRSTWLAHMVDPKQSIELNPVSVFDDEIGTRFRPLLSGQLILVEPYRYCSAPGTYYLLTKLPA